METHCNYFFGSHSYLRDEHALLLFVYQHYLAIFYLKKLVFKVYLRGFSRVKRVKTTKLDLKLTIFFCLELENNVLTGLSHCFTSRPLITFKSKNSFQLLKSHNPSSGGISDVNCVVKYYSNFLLDLVRLCPDYFSYCLMNWNSLNKQSRQCRAKSNGLL